MVDGYQILVTVAGAAPHPEGETGTSTAPILASGEPKRCLFFFWGLFSVVVLGEFGCSAVLAVVIVVAIVVFAVVVFVVAGFVFFPRCFSCFSLIFWAFDYFLTLWLVVIDFVAF